MKIFFSDKWLERIDTFLDTYNHVIGPVLNVVIAFSIFIVLWVLAFSLL